MITKQSKIKKIQQDEKNNKCKRCINKKLSAQLYNYTSYMIHLLVHAQKSDILVCLLLDSANLSVLYRPCETQRSFFTEYSGAYTYNSSIANVSQC